MIQEYIDAYPILQTSFLGNQVIQYVMAVVLVVVYYIAFQTIQSIILGRLRTLTERTETDMDDVLINIIYTLKPPFYSFLAFYFALNSLSLSGYISKILNALLITWVVYQAIYAVEILIDYFAKKKLLLYEDENDVQSAVEAINIISRIVLWSLGGLLVLSNIGIDVTSLIAGLGIGGIAVAFAVKGLLEDLFSSFTIFFDRPFRVGDFIVVGGNEKGTVQDIGIKTTRIKSLAGEEIVLPNQKLTAEVIQNYKRMESRRVEASVGVTYETSQKKLEKIPKMIEKIVTKHEGVELNRVHLKTMGDSALIFEYVYVVENSDYNVYMDIRHDINMQILKRFAKEKISIAYPTQTVFVNK